MNTAAHHPSHTQTLAGLACDGMGKVPGGRTAARALRRSRRPDCNRAAKTGDCGPLCWRTVHNCGMGTVRGVGCGVIRPLCWMMACTIISHNGPNHLRQLAQPLRKPLESQPGCSCPAAARCLARLRQRKAKAVSAAKAAELNARQRQCLSSKDSGNTMQGKGTVSAATAVKHTSQRHCLSREGSRNSTQGTGTVSAAKTVATQCKAKALS